MLEALQHAANAALGLHSEARELTALQMALRAVTIFVISTIYIRVGSRRFIGRSTSLDVVLGIVFGSVMSRAITGNAPFVPTLAAGLTLVALHWALSALSLRHHAFGRLVKGNPIVLVSDGEVQWDEMGACHISMHDLEEALRIHGLPPDVTAVKLATMERNGDISIVPYKEDKPPIIKPPK